MAASQPASTEARSSVLDSRAGIVIRFGGTLRFVPLGSVLLVAPESPITMVPGTSLGVALVGERVTAVFRLGPSTGQLVLCELAGEAVSLAGVEVVASGEFAASDGGVRYADTTVPLLDLADQLGRADDGADCSVEAQDNLE